MAHLTDLKPLLAETAASDIPEGKTFYLTDDNVFDQMLNVEPMLSAQEAATPFIGADIYGDLGRLVRLHSDEICSFSGIVVLRGEGVATPIQPANRGGDIHVKNLIYLHDEPAALFSRFAWTIGADFEIIVDSWAMGTSVLSTVNETGKLRVGADQSFWPDAEALAWHRQQFFDRLR